MKYVRRPTVRAPAVPEKLQEELGRYGWNESATPAAFLRQARSNREN
jgi:hypothetical protein